MLHIPCVIFAGGKSSRMGENKALLPFAGSKTLTQFQLSRLNKIFKTVYISCKDKNIFDFDASFIEDVNGKDIYAPTAGFVSVFNAIQDDKFFALSVDSPFISEKEINKIIKADKNDTDATIAKTDFGIHPICGIYHRSLHDKFINMLQTDNHKLGILLKSSNTNFVHFKNEKPFLNINHPHEYQEAIKLI